MLNTGTSLRPAGIGLAPREVVNSPYLLRFLFALFVPCVLARLFVTANVLDLVENYTTTQGSFIEKIHPANYAIAAIALMVLPAIRVELTRWELRVVRAFVALVACIAVMFAVMWPLGQVGSAGYLIDAYVFACVAGALMLIFPPAWRTLAGDAILMFLILSAIIAVGEFATRQRLLPNPDVELVFRPTGLLGHPLTIGTCTGMAIPFVSVTRWPAAAKMFAIGALLLGTFAANARLGTIVATAVTFLVVLWMRHPSLPPQRQMQIKLLTIIAGLLGIPVLLAGLFAAGFADRFFERGLFDESAMARVSIYRLFELVSWRDILLGTDIEAVRKIALERFELEFIESPFVIFIFQFGLVGTVVFLFFLVRTLVALLAGAYRNVVLAACAFLLVALGNNTLASKTPTIEMLFLLVIAYHPPEPSVRNRRRTIR